MIIKNSTIKPGIGFGPIKFGMDRDTVRSLIGEPGLEEQENNDQDIVWHYYEEAHMPTIDHSSTILTLIFRKEDEYKLSMISVSGGIESIDHKKIEIFGNRLADLTLTETEKLLAENNIKDAKIEKTDVLAGGQPVVRSEEKQFSIYFKNDKFDYVYMTPLFLDDDTYQWPE